MIMTIMVTAQMRSTFGWIDGWMDIYYNSTSYAARVNVGLQQWHKYDIADHSTKRSSVAGVANACR